MKEIDLNLFSERLKELRNEKKLTTIQLAKKLGVSDASVSRWENQLRIPTIANLYKMALFFDVSADYLIGLED